jgi:CelD/BcsL family acetyltransferase involved in cellulose biosynthesis
MNMPVQPSSLATHANPMCAPTTTKILDQDELLALGAEWEELIEHAAEETAYLSRQYVEALLAHIERRRVSALSIWLEGKLIALLPFTQNRSHWLGLTRLNQAWTTLYSMLSIPLIDKRYSEPALNALVSAMGDRSTGSNIWLLREVTLTGPVSKALQQKLVQTERPFAVLDSFDRAILTRGSSFDTHMKESVSKKRRKDLVRNRKRLGEVGHLSIVNYNNGPELDHAVDEFLRIEAAGWKGDAGTALDCTSETRAFAKQAFGVHKGASITRADVLELDGKAIAVNLSLQSGRTAFTVKCAFDENYRTYSAGLLLEEDMIREFLEGSWADKLDSATAPGHLIQGLWNGSTEVGDILVAAGPTMWPFRVYELLETTRRRAREKAKSLVASLRALKS